MNYINHSVNKQVEPDIKELYKKYLFSKCGELIQIHIIKCFKSDKITSLAKKYKPINFMETTLEHILTNTYKADMITYLTTHPKDFEEAIKLTISDKQPY